MTTIRRASLAVLAILVLENLYLLPRPASPAQASPAQVGRVRA